MAIIASLNAVWGYPLVGLLSSLVVLMATCAAVNRLFRPRVRASTRLPEMVSANSTVNGTIVIENVASLPAFDITLSLVDMPREWSVLNGPHTISELKPAEPLSCEYAFKVGGRGIHAWPAMKWESSFPFFLFRSKQVIPFGSSARESRKRILVTPTIIESNVPEFVRTLLSRGTNAGGVRTGESLDYLGSREYVYGDSVRRWDFASWARLGRPIIRQFDLNSTGNLTIVVDTFLIAKSKSDAEHELENRLSLAASIIHSLRNTACEIHLILPKIDEIESVRGDHSMQRELLQPLATATGIRLNGSRPSGLIGNVWSNVAAIIDPASPVVCIMSSSDPATKQHDRYSNDLDRQKFLDRVANSGASLVIMPGDDGRTTKNLNVAHV